MVRRNLLLALAIVSLGLSADALAQVVPSCPAGMVLQSCPALCVATPTPIPPTPTPVPPTPTPAPTATPLPQTIAISAPANGTVAISSTVVKDNDGPTQCGGAAWYDELYVDGSRVADCGFSACTIGTRANGSHSIFIRAHTSNNLPNPRECAQSQTVGVWVGPIPTPTPAPATATPVPTGTPTPDPQIHLSNLAPGAPLPGDAYCVGIANAVSFPNVATWNDDDGSPAHWNSNNQIWGTPSYFYQHAGENLSVPNADFQTVNGNYAPPMSGMTQNILRWAACKWGVDEDWVYAESQEESGWHQDCAMMHGGSGCHEGGDSNNPDSTNVNGSLPLNLSFLGFPVSDSSGHFMYPAGNWASWGVIQSKAAYAEWYASPMLALSTAWGSDYRWAKYRACVNGDYVSRFNSTDYNNAVSRAKSNPDGLVPGGQGAPTNLFANETNLEYLDLGCIATHFCGGWYKTGDTCTSYLTNANGSDSFIPLLTNLAWPGSTP